MCYVQLVGVLVARITYKSFKARLADLAKIGLLNAELADYRGRTVTRYSLTISGHNYLTELERLAKAAKFTLDS